MTRGEFDLSHPADPVGLPVRLRRRGQIVYRAAIGTLIGESAMPMALTVATTGTLALVLFWTTRRIRRL